ncbi:MAG: FecR family protein [Thermodesulfobacteriota bacterium]
MRKRIRLALVILIVMALLIPMTLHAAVVGRFTQVRGPVDLLKKGNIPAIPAKLRDGVEPGDVIRTKARGKAQLTMVDNSVITLAPESRLAVADYVYDPAKRERRAVVRLFRGLVHTVVNRVIRTEEPDFIMETHTSVIGVRGTTWYTLLAPSFASVYLVRGTLSVRSNLPTVPALLLLQSMQFTQIPIGKQPFLPQPLTPDMLRLLDQLMDTGLTGRGLSGSDRPHSSEDSQLGFPISPDQQLRQEYIPQMLQPQPHISSPTPSLTTTPSLTPRPSLAPVLPPSFTPSGTPYIAPRTFDPAVR